MIQVGYLAKRICERPEWLRAPNVVDILSVGDCVSENFADYIQFWKHNGYWLFDSPEIICSVALENSIDLKGTSLFFYEAHELEYSDEGWRSFSPEPSFTTKIIPPSNKILEGFDVVAFWAANSPEHSPLSCNSLAENVVTNSHCL